jgi:hypothetical protein
MDRSSARPRARLALCLVALTGLAAAADRPPSEADVRALMSRVEHASQARDVATLAAVLAPDCRIELTAMIDGHEQVTLMTREEYIEALTRGFAAMKDLAAYEYRVTDLAISFEESPPAATVVSHVHESFVFQGRHGDTDSSETTRIERRGGALQLVAVASRTEGR